MRRIGIGFLLTNIYIAAISIAAWIVPLPETGTVRFVVIGVTGVVAIVTVILMTKMLFHMLFGRLSAGHKFVWCLVFLLTAYVGSTAYYILVYRHSRGTDQDLFANRAL